jgi:hypothetical protein
MPRHKKYKKIIRSKNQIINNLTCHQKIQLKDNFKSFKILQGLKSIFFKQGIIAGTVFIYKQRQNHSMFLVKMFVIISKHAHHG